MSKKIKKSMGFDEKIESVLNGSIENISDSMILSYLIPPAISNLPNVHLNENYDVYIRNTDMYPADKGCLCTRAFFIVRKVGGSIYISHENKLYEVIKKYSGRYITFIWEMSHEFCDKVEFLLENSKIEMIPYCGYILSASFFLAISIMICAEDKFHDNDIINLLFEEICEGVKNQGGIDHAIDRGKLDEVVAFQERIDEDIYMLLSEQLPYDELVERLTEYYLRGFGLQQNSDAKDLIKELVNQWKNYPSVMYRIWTVNQEQYEKDIKPYYGILRQKRISEYGVAHNNIRKINPNIRGTEVVVTDRISQLAKFEDDFFKIKNYEKTKYSDGNVLNKRENVDSYLIGLAVDYLTRVVMGYPKDEVFAISMVGAQLALKKNEGEKILAHITGLDDDSILNTIKMAAFDDNNDLKDSVKPSSSTIENIRIMVKRTLDFFEASGPVIRTGFTFDGAGTDIVKSGVGDYMTNDAIWDLKVLKKAPSYANMLQIATYWRMGIHSTDDIYKCVKYIGVFNPRLNIAYRISVDMASASVINYLDKEVIGY